MASRYPTYGKKTLSCTAALTKFALSQNQEATIANLLVKSPKNTSASSVTKS